ncbi:MAG: sigma-70 family RNA polymerase sigma factor [Polyangiaceae bacterium]|jgi:RNA polymerase sigma-70 factor (ECF subfamily)
MDPPQPLIRWVRAAQSGDVAAFGALVQATQAMAYATAWKTVRREADARDAVQDAYLTAFRRLVDLQQPEAFAGWLRRIVIATALNHRRRIRALWVPGHVLDPPPVLDEEEQRWTPDQQRWLARALLTLAPEQRKLCELHYHGGCPAEQLARAAGVEPATVRKRLQRIRDQLRREIEMDEARSLDGRPVPANLPEHIVELLARPRLAELPDNPVAATLAALRGAFPGFAVIDDLPEVVNLERAKHELGGDAVYIERSHLQRIEGETVLRYDLTLPLLLQVRWAGRGLRLTAAGKTYRVEQESATRLEAFHQLEVFVVDERPAVDLWWFAGRLLDAVDRLMPNSEVRLTPTEYPMCERAFSLDVRRADDWYEVMAWGQYAPWVVRALGADPVQQVAIGAGFGLERCAMLRYAIDDIRKVATARLAHGSVPR